ncbi:hypothetical protein K450DRAFT_217450 [Umbelopsis ramanniana AG]|uniref:DNA polymerase n=1 Tax=Umbelopsis ramanniana AG TaxID=1314678 RepID=A0AAD5EJ55_UMBRA|nr:uncharacterized protein K450DRAFT_217450 [Umbelopsis ramanniana AG]KAI8584678.1 hypothetical protein K450DRAFT_217450 [Umbelopsis ramanniana AG]
MSGPSTRSAFLKVRIVNIDHYLAEPGSMDNTLSPFSSEPQALLKVPIVRVFGSTPAGQKVCLHIHQAFPYFYVPYPEQDTSLDALQSYSYQLGQTLNKAMALSMKKDPNSPQHNQYVVAIVPVKGVPFYGYHVGYQCYLKIYLLKPSYKLRMVELLQRGGVMTTFFQPHEAHIPYELQFLMDYNLYGMNWIELDNRTAAPIKFRSPLPEERKANIHLTPGSNPEQTENIFTKYTVSPNLVSDEYERSSHCELEVDAICSSIINRRTLQERDIHKDFKEAFGLLASQEQEINSQEAKLVHSLAAIWEEESRRRTSKGQSPQVPPVTQEDNRKEHEGWNSELEYRSRIHDRIQSEQFSEEDIRNMMDKVAGHGQDLDHLLTAWEAVAAITMDCQSLNIAAITPERPLSSNVGITPGLAQGKGYENLIDKSILDTILDDAGDQEVTDVTEAANDAAREQEPDLFEKGEYDLEDFDDPEALQWMALQEEGTSQRKHIQIGYEEENERDVFAEIRPRKLDFISELSKYSQSSSQGSSDEYGVKGKGRKEPSKSIDQVDGANDEDDVGDGKLNTDPQQLKWESIVQGNKNKSSTGQTVSNTNASKDTHSGRQSSNSKAEKMNESTRKRKDHSDELETLPTSPKTRIRRIRKTATLDIAPAPVSPSELYTPKDFIESERNNNMPFNIFVADQSNPGSPLLYSEFTENENAIPKEFHVVNNGSPPLLSHREMSVQRQELPSGHTKDEKPATIVPLQSTLKKKDVEEPVEYPMATVSAVEKKASTQTSETSAHSHQSIVNSETSEEEKYFTSRLNRMWSPKQSETEATAFRHHPPDITSPTQSKSQIMKSTPNPSELYGLENDTQPGTENEPNLVSTEVTYGEPPPTLDSKHRIDVVYQEPYYSDRRDAPRRPKIYAGKEFKLKTLEPSSFEEFSIIGPNIINLNSRNSVRTAENFDNVKSSTSSWTPSTIPPTYRDALKWLEREAAHLHEEEEKRKHNTQESDRINANFDSSNTPTKKKQVYTQIEPPTPQNRYGIKFMNTKTDAIKPIKEHLDLLSVEIHVNSQQNRLPDPRKDPIEIIFWCLQTEDENVLSNGRLPGARLGLIVCHKTSIEERFCLPDIDVQYVDDELHLLELFVSKVRLYDPDILAGYELHNSSWGYIIERCVNQYEINLIDELSRIKPGAVHAPRSDAWGYRKAAIFRIVGRHLLNVWRVMRSEIDLTSYRYENIVFHLLHNRVPHYSNKTLTGWYTSKNATLKEKVCRYYLDRVQRNLELLDVSNMLSRTTESARTFGIDFYSVITRGSQFKVESMMLRIAKPENFILVSPSRKQVGELSAAECLPLVMEPISQFYSSPMLVLDFQSLYPSVMIAYNYCYSTCLGKVENFKREYIQRNQLRYGMDTLDLPPEVLKLMEEHINVSPTGLMFVKPSIRKSLLAKMLGEILDTRVMVKRAMGEEKKNKGLYRLLDARQLGLKFLANVTYGYTSATFSGRMPAVEIADSIVQTGRETLERAIDLINNTKKWGARVVYGDTDSVFVYLPGRSRDEAFTIGDDIADTITKMNPVPVKLKFEKVYHPCVLVTKKRYVGFKYETRDWKKPEFEAKGIETVRRDGIPATQKMLEQSLRILFKSQDMSEVKAYLQDQWMSILSGRVSEQDFILAQEVRLGEYREGYESVGARVAMANMKLDPRAEPQYGDRVPYVIVARGPNVKLRDKPMSPLAYMADSSLRLDAEYYITKQIIPALERIFNLCGVDIASWYKQMPRRKQALAYSFSQLEEYNGNSKTLEQYYSSRHCVVCRKISDNELCKDCLMNGAETLFTMKMRLNDVQTRFGSIQEVCQSCSGVLSSLSASVAGGPESSFGSSTGYADHPCDSIDCPVFFQRQKLKRDVRVLSTYDTIIDRWF